MDEATLDTRAYAALTNGWKGESGRWGHRLHSMCSYMAMFPPKIPHYFIERCTRPGDAVLDPFSGRGTTALQACLDGRIGIGNDLNILAYALTRAKTDIPSREAVMGRLDLYEAEYRRMPESSDALDEYARLSSAAVAGQQTYRAGRRCDCSRGTVDRALWARLQDIVDHLRRLYASNDPSMPFFRSLDYRRDAESSQDVGFSDEHHHPIWAFFHPETLRQLSYLRQRLGDDREDAFIKATTLGIMHGRGRFYLSLPMPNTFSQTPNYVISYAYRNTLVLPMRDVFRCLRDKMELMGFPGSFRRGHAVLGDVRRLVPNLTDTMGRTGRPKLVVSSPPYLGVIKYGQYNWIRLWFLEPDAARLGLSEGEGPGTCRLDRVVDGTLDDGHHDLASYLDFMKSAMEQVYDVMDPHSTCAFVIGDIESTGGRRGGSGAINLAEHVLHEAAEPVGFHHLGTTIADSVPDNLKVTRIWNERRGQATRVDRILLLCKEGPSVYDVPVTW